MSVNKIPDFAERFFRWICHQTNLEGLEGDLYELFEMRVEERGLSRARLYYFIDVLTLIRPSVIKSFAIIHKTNNATMGIINNYIKTTFRMGKKRLWFSSINLVGLTMGITSILFILLFIADELKFDTHIADLDDKFRVYNIVHREDGETNQLPIVPPVFAAQLQENFPQVLNAGRVMFDYGGTVFTIEENAYSEKHGVFAEPEALEILDIEMVSGNWDRFDEPMSLLLSERTFQKFFGEVPFTNQTIQWGESELQVLGVFKDLPEQSHSPS